MEDGNALTTIGIGIAIIVVANWLGNQPAKLPTAPQEYGFVGYNNRT